LSKSERRIPSNLFVPIVADGAIAQPDFGDGRLIPVLIVDCSKRPDLRDLIVSHEDSPPGDVSVTWGKRPFQNQTVMLLMEFTRPANVQVALEFDVFRQGGLVDAILHNCGVYLQPLEFGARVIEGMDKGKIIAEVPDTGFRSIWDSLYHKRVAKELRRQGLSRADAAAAAEEHIRRFRDIWKLRRKITLPDAE